MIFKQSISCHLVFIIILFRSRSPKRRHQDSIACSLFLFFWDTLECEHARGARGKAARNEGEPQSLLLFCLRLGFRFVAHQSWLVCNSWSKKVGAVRTQIQKLANITYNFCNKYNTFLQNNITTAHKHFPFSSGSEIRECFHPVVFYL